MQDLAHVGTERQTTWREADKKTWYKRRLHLILCFSALRWCMNCFFLDGCCDSCTSKDITVMCIPMNRCEFGFNWCQIQSVLNVAAAQEHTLTQRVKNAMHGSFHQPLRRSVLFSLICCIYSSFVVILHIKEMGRQRRLCCPWQDATEFRK